MKPKLTMTERIRKIYLENEIALVTGTIIINSLIRYTDEDQNIFVQSSSNKTISYYILSELDPSASVLASIQNIEKNTITYYNGFTNTESKVEGD
jgi:hypothetical protein